MDVHVECGFEFVVAEAVCLWKDSNFVLAFEI
jgi:hypothetical protein